MSQKRLLDLPIGIQTFEELRKNNFLYVDKTKDVYEFARIKTPCFLARPRRFGKSILCTTFKALFEGKKHLFEGTWIANSDWQWQEHPIIHIDINTLVFESPTELRCALQDMLHTMAKQHHVVLPQKAPGAMLQMLVKELAIPGKAQPVVLIDEYDKPIVNNLSKPRLLKAYREMLYNFYTPLKSLDTAMRFLFITGVSQVGRLSVFSALNHLNILSNAPKAATLCGYTQTDLEYNFAEYLDCAAKKLTFTKEHLLAEIKHWYNGYCFTIPEDAPDKVYNPFSVLNFFENLQFKNYWFESGTSTFAIEFFKKHKFSLTDFTGVHASGSQLNSLNPEKLSLTTVLYQTGYLTIKSFTDRQFILGFPNQEVAESCSAGLLDLFEENASTPLLTYAQQLRNLFVSNKVTESDLEIILKKICAHIPSVVAPTKERGYQLAFYLVLQLVGLNVTVEEPTAIGRIDAVIITENTIFVLELKIRGSATKALEQIEEKRYDEKYRDLGKQIIRIGAVFDIKKRTITACKIL